MESPGRAARRLSLRCALDPVAAQEDHMAYTWPLCVARRAPAMFLAHSHAFFQRITHGHDLTIDHGVRAWSHHYVCVSVLRQALCPRGGYLIERRCCSQHGENKRSKAKFFKARTLSKITFLLDLYISFCGCSSSCQDSGHLRTPEDLSRENEITAVLNRQLMKIEIW